QPPEVPYKGITLTVYCPEQLASGSVYQEHDPELMRRQQEEAEEYWRSGNREIFVNSTNALAQPYLFKVFAGSDGKLAFCNVQVNPRSAADTNDFAAHHFSGTLRISNSLDGLIFESSINPKAGHGLSLKGDEYLPALKFVFRV